MKRVTLLLISLSLALVLFVGCGGKKDDTAGGKYAEVCSKVAKCDPNMAMIPDGQKACEMILVALEERAPAAVPAIVECVEQQECSEVSIQECGAGHLQGIPGLIQ